MTFIPPWEKIAETKKCRISGEEFFITDKDLEFYEKISPVFAGQKYLIPTPTLCPDERQRRRLAFRNETKFYHRKCDKSGNQIISVYSPEKPYTVYDQKVWWGDDWSSYDFGRNFDFEKSFFEQFQWLQLVVPRVNLFAKNCENSEFTNHTDHIKNSYLSVDVADSENIYYSRWVLSSKSCIDCYRIEDSELCYGSQYIINGYAMIHCFLCHGSSHCLFCENIRNCHECILCYWIQGKQYHIMNKSYAPDEYAIKKMELMNMVSSNMPLLRKIFQDLIKNLPRQNLVLRNTENVFWDMIDNSKSVFQSFDISNGENLKYCYEATWIRDSYDVFESWFDCEQQYECYASNRTSFSHFCTIGYDNSFNIYCDLCNNSQHCFGSIGIRKWKYSILNHSYSIQEYETLCGKIIEHMKSTGEWWEFFPLSLSPFGYNETVAQEHFGLTQDVAMSHGWKWKWEEETSSYHWPYYAPLSIDNYNERIVGYTIAQKNIDEVLKWIIQCEISGRPFKIIKQELLFYIENNLPLPSKHPDQRHKERMSLRNPRTLHERDCAECGKKTITTYVPNRSERVVCEECYRKLVY